MKTVALPTDSRTPNTGGRRAEVEKFITDKRLELVATSHEEKLCSLADEVDELRGKLDDVRSGIGCARGQQYCAEAAARDEIITKLLEIIECARGSYFGSVTAYDRALEIAGRKE